MISILVTGISGRMGQAIQEAVTQNPDTCVGSTHDQGQELYPALAKCDVAIDFSHHAFIAATAFISYPLPIDGYAVFIREVISIPATAAMLPATI